MLVGKKLNFWGQNKQATLRSLEESIILFNKQGLKLYKWNNGIVDTLQRKIQLTEGVRVETKSGTSQYHQHYSGKSAALVPELQHTMRSPRTPRCELLHSSTHGEP